LAWTMSSQPSLSRAIGPFLEAPSPEHAASPRDAPACNEPQETSRFRRAEELGDYTPRRMHLLGTDDALTGAHDALR